MYCLYVVEYGCVVVSYDCVVIIALFSVRECD